MNLKAVEKYLKFFVYVKDFCNFSVAFVFRILKISNGRSKHG